MKAKQLAGLLLLTASPAFSAGWTQWAVPTRIDVVRSDGFVIYGDFGNPGGCSDSGRLYVKASHSRYKEIYAAALTAFAGKYRVSAYVQNCEPAAWYAGPAYTFNVVDPATVLNIGD